jgi:hypothetical protein
MPPGGSVTSATPSISRCDRLSHSDRPASEIALHTVEVPHCDFGSGGTCVVFKAHLHARFSNPSRTHEVESHAVVRFRGSITHEALQACVDECAERPADER